MGNELAFWLGFYLAEAFFVGVVVLFKAPGLLRLAAGPRGAGGPAPARELVQGLAGLVGSGDAFRRVTLRLYAKFAGESLSDEEFKAILEEARRDVRQKAGPGSGV